MSENKIPPERNKWEDSTIILNGWPVDIQNEDRFSPVNTFAFNPLSQNTLSLDNAILAFLMVKLAKENPTALAHLIEKYIDSATDILTAIVNTGKSHPITAINAATEFAVVAHRFGLITDAGYLKLADQTRSIIDKLIQLSGAGIAFDGLSTLLESGGKVAGGALQYASTMKGLKP